MSENVFLSPSADSVPAHSYANGEAIPQNWSPVFIFFAFVTSFVASYSAVRLLDHTLWRSEKEKEHASAIIIRQPQCVAACLLGVGTVWSMHFVGMAAVTLERTPMCYDWPVTVGSLFAAVVFMLAGVSIASRDVFRGPDRVKILKDIAVKMPNVTAKGRHREADRAIHAVAFFHKPWFILAAAAVAAAGALIMHYTGMMALRGPFRKRWSVPFVASSVVIGVLVCCAGFWILFRLLLWKVEQFWLRPASAAVIALAVCGLHFFGMLSVTYVYDDSLVGICGGSIQKSHLDPNAWTPHQVLALAVALGVPSVALLIENLICRELFHAYCKLKNPSLTIEYILEAASRSRDVGVRRASHMARTDLDLAAQMKEAAAASPTSGLSRELSRNHSGLSLAASSRRRSSLFGGSGSRRGSRTYCDCACHAYDNNNGEEKKEVSTHPTLTRAEDHNRRFSGKRVSFCWDVDVPGEDADASSKRDVGRRGSMYSLSSQGSFMIKKARVDVEGSESSDEEQGKGFEAEQEQRAVETAACVEGLEYCDEDRSGGIEAKQRAREAAATAFGDGDHKRALVGKRVSFCGDAPAPGDEASSKGEVGHRGSMCSVSSRGSFVNKKVRVEGSEYSDEEQGKGFEAEQRAAETAACVEGLE